MWEYNYSVNSADLYHHGVKGMKWGVRRNRKTSGNLTNREIKKYAKKGYAKDAYNRNKSSAGKIYDKVTGAHKINADITYNMSSKKENKARAEKYLKDAKGLKSNTKPQTRSAPSKKSNAKPQTRSASSKKSNPPNKSTVSKGKQKTDRMIKALETQEKAQKVSLMTTGASLALRSMGQTRTAQLVSEYGYMQASRLSFAAGYDYWR